VANSLRLARDKIGNYRLLTTADFSELGALHRELTAVVRRHLPTTAASLLAQPVPSADGATVDWLTDLTGEARLLGALPPAPRAIVRKKLADRLGSLRRLADELPQRVRGSEDLANALRAATHYPGDDHVYVVGDDPVLTLWGFVKAGAGGRLVSPSRAAGFHRARRLMVGLGVALFALIAAAGGGWLWWIQDQEQALRDAIAGVLASGCADSGQLALLDRRVHQLDPDGKRLADLRHDIAAEQRRCAEGEALHAALAAGWDCGTIARLEARVRGQDLDRPPFEVLAREIAARRAVCDQAGRLAAAFDNALGDCTAVADVQIQLQRVLRESATETSPMNGGGPSSALPEPGGSPRQPGTAPPEPLARLRDLIGLEQVRCDEAAMLAQDLDAAGSDCDALKRIDGRLAEKDMSRPPLASFRKDLEDGLARCDRADELQGALIDAQQNCAAFKVLDTQMQGPEMRRPPFLEVREQLDGLLEACRKSEAIEQTRREAAGDCPRLAALAEDVRGRFGSNLLFIGLRQRIARDTRDCALGERLRAELAAAAGDCEALANLGPRIKSIDPDIPMLDAVREGLTDELALCRDAENWRRRILAAEKDCERVSRMRSELPDAAADVGQFRDIRARLDSLNRQCEADSAKTREAARIAATERARSSETPPNSKPDTRVKSTTMLCPGERKKNEAPQLVMVFDASGSMRHGINASPEALRALRQVGDAALGGLLGALGGALQSAASGPSRMEAAKDAGRRIVHGLPADVDIGLVKIESCPAATSAGFFPPARRGTLLGRIGALRPRKDTPLASGVAQAASMVDGVSRPAVIALISDGKDTCGGDVCAVAARIARSKPLLKINVVDITGTGAAGCAARATGGRVLRASNAAELGSQMQRATEEVAGPAECRRG
jgi:hypothetical protein